MNNNEPLQKDISPMPVFRGAKIPENARPSDEIFIALSRGCGKPQGMIDEAYRRGKADGRKEAIDEVIKSYTTGFPTSLCTYCSQEACYGGMVGSIQECNFIKMLKDVLNDFGEELKE